MNRRRSIGRRRRPARKAKLSLRTRMGRVALQMQNREIVQARRVGAFWRTAGSGRSDEPVQFGDFATNPGFLQDVRYSATQNFGVTDSLLGVAMFANSTFGQFSGVGAGGNRIFVGNHWCKMTFVNRYQENEAQTQAAYPVYIRAMIVRVSDDALTEVNTSIGKIQGVVGQVAQSNQFCGPLKLTRAYDNKDICALRWKLNPSVGTIAKSKTIRLNSGESRTISLRHLVNRAYTRISEGGSSVDFATSERTYCLLVHVHGVYASTNLDMSAEAYTSYWNLGQAQTFTLPAPLLSESSQAAEPRG